MARQPRRSAVEVLAALPEALFDVDEYRASCEYRGYLEQRIATFGHAARVGDEQPWPARAGILGAVRSGRFADIPHYRDLANVAGIEDLPFIRKRDLREAPADFVLPDRGERRWLKLTTGSSGAPIPVPMNGEAYFEQLVLALRGALAMAGLTEACATRPLLCLAISDFYTSDEFMVADPTEKLGLTLRIVVDETVPQSLERAMRLIRECEPACVSTKPSVYEMLLETIPSGERPDPIALLSSGSVLTRDLRRRLETAFSGKVLDVYGMTEVGLIATECEYGGRHVDSAAKYVEIVDSSGDPLPPGQQGEVVVSCVTNSVMPLCRYRTADRAALVIGRCGCGRNSPRLVEITGRYIPSFRLDSGAAFAPTFFNDLFQRFDGLVEFQITQEAVGRFALALEVEGSADARNELERRVAAYVRASIPGEPMLRVEQRRFGRDSKFQRFRSLL